MVHKILDWKKYRDLAVELAAEGAVLVKNDRDALPVNKDSKVALFGRMQANYYKSGTGSGGMVNVEHVTDIREGLLEAGVNLDKDLMEIYDKWEIDNPVDPGVGWGQERWSQDEMIVDESFAKRFAENNDVAIIVIGRTAGEDRDNLPSKGSYYLTDEEEQLLSSVTSAFEKTVVLLNVGNIIDMNWVKKYDPASVMYVWQCGMYGGDAVAKLITGEISPSGSLTDTIAYNLSDYPSDSNFGNKDPMEDIYEEDIFVGYRYFSTFAPQKVMYPFGFGLSYTTFNLETADFAADNGDITVRVKVTNTGDRAGAKSVMLFADAPMGVVSKPSRVFIGFAKTSCLNPGQSEEVEVTAPRTRFASYDDDGRAGHGTCWLLEKGDYTFLIGSSVEDVIPAGQMSLDDDMVIENLKSAAAPVKPFKRMTNSGTEDTPLRKHENIDDRFESVKGEISQTGDKGIKLRDVKEGRNTLDEFIAQLRDEDLSLIIRGEGMSSPKVTTGTAGAFAGASKHLKELGVPTLCCADGPSGMRIDSGKKAFSLPNGACIASSMNKKLISELFECFGLEMISNGVDAILGPGMNIHRHPLNGRNFEYFSEDPVLTGLIVSSELEGLGKAGVTGVIKHFCANNREMNRRLMNSVVSEKALREIYLKGFEIAIKEGGARSIMSVYNRINGVYGTSNYEINTEILRNQWGYDGIVMTDWWAYIDEVPDISHDTRGLTEHSLMARAQCDLFMVCSAVDEPYLDESDIMECLSQGKTDMITRAELQRNAANILRYAMKSQAMEKLCDNGTEIEHKDYPFSDEGVTTKVDKYFEVTGDRDREVVIDIDTDTSTGADYVFGLDSDTPGRYDVSFTATSDLNALAQIPMTIYCTSIPFRVITWNGLEGGEGSKDTTFVLMTKYNVFRIHFGGAGVKLKTMKIRFKVKAEDDPDPEM